MSHTLGYILQQLHVPVSHLSCADITVTGISQDSRFVRPGHLFLALGGAASHGKFYLQQAIERGASAVITDDPELVQTALPVICVHDVRARIPMLVDAVYGHNVADIPLIGITGTNGKTTCASLIAQILYHMGQKPAFLGTIGRGLWPDLVSSPLTTADYCANCDAINTFSQQGSSHVVIEASSHALDQQRLHGLRFTTGVFTNLSHDHLDYHGTMANYASAKARLFTDFALQYAVINRDDPVSTSLLSACGHGVACVTYGTTPNRQPYTDDIAPRNAFEAVAVKGLIIDSPWGEFTLNTTLLGRFNLSNCLCAVAVCAQLTQRLEDIIAILPMLQPAPGRLQPISVSSAQTIETYVDFAHTPDALANVCAVLRQKTQQQLWCVFGCGGERDTAKRPKMALAAARYANQLVVTSDNPRSEPASAIMDAIVSELENKDNVVLIEDRATAIAYALNQACDGDIVLIAGKGHENYQIINHEKRPCDDKLIAETTLRERFLC